MFIDPKSLKDTVDKLNLKEHDENLNLNSFIDNLHSIEEIEDLIENFKDNWSGSKDIKNFVSYQEHLEIINLYIKQSNSNFKFFNFLKMFHQKE